MSNATARPRRRPPPAPGSRAFYLEQAETCLTAAAGAQDLTARELHEQECRLWLMLAQQREAIEAVLQRYMDTPDAA